MTTVDNIEYFFYRSIEHMASAKIINNNEIRQQILLPLPCTARQILGKSGNKLRRQNL